MLFRSSSLCYTSGTTGNPKGVLYSHRSTVLHSFAACLPDGMFLSARETLMPIVPMFHANAWGLPYSAASRAARMRGGDMGTWFMRTPTALEIAFPMAASGGTMEVSPTPRTP